MFHKIPLITTEAKTHLTSKKLPTPASLSASNYNQDALRNTEFMVWGSVDSFRKPPITDFAINHLYYMQDFDIFHYKEGSFTKRANFDSFLVAYTYSGNGVLTYRERTYPLALGDGFFINCKDSHMYQVEGTNWDVAILHLAGPLLPDFYELFYQQAGPVFHEELSAGYSARPTYQQLLESFLLLYSQPKFYRDWYVSNAINNLLLHLLTLSTELSAQKTEVPDNIQYLIKYIDSNYTQDLTLDYLSKFSNISKYYLSREFKKYTGFSPYNYLISLRIDTAKKLLQSTDLPVSQIAEEVGIHDINNFTNLFKKRTGMTPVQFRNMN